MTHLKNSVAIVTGSAKRIGAAIIKDLHKQGINVAIHYRQSSSAATELCDWCNTRRENSAIIIKANFNQPDTFSPVIAATINQWQRLDILINNASEYFPTPVGTTTHQQWHQLMNSNLLAPYFLAQEAAPYLAQQQGSIINLSDINGIHPKKNYPVYCAAKAGLNMLTQSLAKELAPNIRVNAIAPSTTCWAENPEEQSSNYKEKVITESLLHKKTEPENIITAIHYLLEQSSATGQILVIDNGKLLF